MHKLWDHTQPEQSKDGYDSKHKTLSDMVNHNGKYYQLEKVFFAPRPYQKPHPPIFIGTWGSSEAGLKRVAKYGDGWMASAYNITPEKFKEKWNMLLSYRKRSGKDTESFENSIMSMFGYIDNDKYKVKKMVKYILSPALESPILQLENSLLFGSVEECVQKTTAIYDARVERIHFWPISDFEEQIEIFKKDIVL